MKDFLGREITVGCTVVFCVRRGSKLWQQAAVVRALNPGARPWIDAVHVPHGRPVRIFNLLNVIVVDPV